MIKTGLVRGGSLRAGVDEGREIGREENKNDSWERRTQEKINTKHDTNWSAENENVDGLVDAFLQRITCTCTWHTELCTEPLIRD